MITGDLTVRAAANVVNLLGQLVDPLAIVLDLLGVGLACCLQFLANLLVVGSSAVDNLGLSLSVSESRHWNVALQLIVHIAGDLGLHVIDGLQDQIDRVVGHLTASNGILHLIVVVHLVHLGNQVVDIVTSLTNEVFIDISFVFNLDQATLMVIHCVKSLLELLLETTEETLGLRGLSLKRADGVIKVIETKTRSVLCKTWHINFCGVQRLDFRPQRLLWCSTSKICR